MRLEVRTLSQLCAQVTDGTHDSPKLQSKGVPFIKATHITSGVLDFSSCDYITESEHKKVIARSKPEYDDILFTHIGASLGRAARVHTREEFSIKNVALFKPDPKVAVGRYLYYCVISPEFQESIIQKRTGSAQPFVGLDTLRKHTLRIAVELPTQRRIASILSAYDDLIENNTKRIEILEEMARSLYREWFVHFRFPGHEKVKLVDSELGKIPEGWEVKPLAEVAFCRLGKMLDKKKNKGELKPYLGNVNVRWGAFELNDLKEMRFEPHEAEKYGLRYGDIVMCEGGEPGRCALWKEQVPGTMIQKALHRIRANEGVDFVYLYQSLLDEGQSGRISSLFTGATIKHLPGEKLAGVKLKIPTRQVMQLFTNAVGPMEQQIQVLQAKNTVLRQTRDLLLPKLISGEIDVDARDLPEAG